MTSQPTFSIGSGCPTSRLIRETLAQRERQVLATSSSTLRAKAKSRFLSRIAGAVLGALSLTAVSAGMGSLHAQEAVLAPGDAVVSGFSGITMNSGVAPGGSPLDSFFINPDGPSAQILSLYALGGPALGQLVPTVPKLTLKAGQVGQVFAIAIEQTADGKARRFLLGATSAYGLHITKPDAGDPSRQVRTQKGAAGAQWMAGMFGEGGDPGAIYQVDAQSGNVSVFARLPNNSGPGVGDVVLNPANGAVYASDLDTGLIHRIDASGNVVGSFDHGTSGRPAKGLAPLADDGSRAEIASPAFDSANPATWGYTQADRRVHGMAVQGGRLYYAVAGGNQVWSVGLDASGGFAGGARFELEVSGAGTDGPITDMLFDGSGRMYLAFRGAQKGDFGYTAFASVDKAPVLRYRLKTPSDPPSDSRWSSVKDEYAIGQLPQHMHSNGGIALGYQHDAQGSPRIGTCGSFLWTTGDQLRPSRPDVAAMPSGGAGAAPGGDSSDFDVHGLQGNDVSLVKPDNMPPVRSYFVDYDGIYGNPAAIGHIGDVEVLQPCKTDTASLAPPTGAWPGYPEYGSQPLPPLEPPGQPPTSTYSTNLSLEKWATDTNCVVLGDGYGCAFRIRVTNNGPDSYFGPLQINDTFSTRPPGATLHLLSGWPLWSCHTTVPGGPEGICQTPPILLPAGAASELTVGMKIPLSATLCSLGNTASITHAPGGTPWNTDPSDDTDDAAIKIPNPNCPTDSNLQLVKIPQDCEQQDGVTWRCSWRIEVANAGPGVYAGPLVIEDVLTPIGGTDPVISPDWSCLLGGGGATCQPNSDVVLVPGDPPAVLEFSVAFTEDLIRSNACKLNNKAAIVEPVGGTPQNTNGGDDTGDADAAVPADLICPVSPAAAAKPPRKSCPGGQVMVAGACRSAGGPNIVPLVPTLPPQNPPPTRTTDCRDYGMQTVSANDLASRKRQGWKLRHLQSGLWCGIAPPPGGPGTPPPTQTCDRNEQLVTSWRYASRLNRSGRPIRSIVYKGQKAWCVGPGSSTPPPQCETGWISISASQAPAYRAKGYIVDVKSNNAGRTWCARQRPDNVRPPRCASGWTTISANQASAYKAKGYRVDVVRNRAGEAWCAIQTVAPPPPETTKPVCENGNLSRSHRFGWSCSCKSGWKRIALGKRGYRCEPPRPQTCEEKGMTGKWPRCVPKREPCGPGFTGYKPNCKPVPIVCRGNQIKVGNRCVTRELCGRGFTGFKPNCKPVPVVCGANQIKVGNRCVNRQPCGPGFTGFKPNCKPVPVVCRPNQIKVGNRCVTRPIGCPRGMVGRPPNCRPIVKPPTHGGSGCGPGQYRANNGRCVTLR